jgi:hypothetical protein
MGFQAKVKWKLREFEDRNGDSLRRLSGAMEHCADMLGSIDIKNHFSALRADLGRDVLDQRRFSFDQEHFADKFLFRLMRSADMTRKHIISFL